MSTPKKSPSQLRVQGTKNKLAEITIAQPHSAKRAMAFYRWRWM